MAQDALPFDLRRPGPPLSELVDCLWAYEGYTQPHSRERVLPTGCMQLVFRVDAEGRPSGVVAGARSEALVLDTSRPFSAIGVVFRPGGGFPFFGVPASELYNITVTSDLLWGAFAPAVSDRLWEAETPERRFDVLERALLDRARGRLGPHPAVRYALGMFDRSGGGRRAEMPTR